MAKFIPLQFVRCVLETTISGTKRHALLEIASTCDSDGFSNVSVSYLADRLNFSTRHTRRILAELERLGFLERAKSPLDFRLRLAFNLPSRLPSSRRVRLPNHHHAHACDASPSSQTDLHRPQQESTPKCEAPGRRHGRFCGQRSIGSWDGKPLCAECVKRLGIPRQAELWKPHERKER